jgi:nitroreductase
MNTYVLIKKRRSIRKFEQKRIKFNILKKIVNAGRLAPSAANLQFIEYIIVDDKKLVDEIFPFTKWAGYIYPEGTPKGKERPVAYIAILINEKKSSNPDLRDIGASVENMILTALEEGIGSCWLGAIDKKEISKILDLPNYAKLDSLLALGYPQESPKVVKYKNSIKYFRDKNGRHFVPKRDLKDILFRNEYR